ncbi:MULTISPECIES: mycothiol system anti-sigma-R factor [Corynebacterium]|uniref:Anti-sigma factor RshA n=1 Tax=Corynebacterium provencense TaxID=1737425 RepID=A0A2Z3YRB3_9CORY|nr:MULTISPECIES: mycothiol system anti-sigma-R factor [Corynebacterium]AWT25610.1 Anti-sigma factor RshA [Corynebacterium provencense]
MTDNQRKFHSDCDDLVDVLYEYVDGGCDESLRARLAAHVENCPTCLEQLGIEQQVRQLLRARCCNSAPEDLRGRIVTALRSTTVRRTVGSGDSATVTEVTEVTASVRRVHFDRG